MPISRPEKFTVTQTYGLAQSRRCFPTENEPIFRYRRPGLKPEGDAKTNSQYAIQKTGVNSGSVHADHQGAPAAIPFLRSPDPLQKIRNEAISHLAATTPECEAQTLKNAAAPICNALAKAAGVRNPRHPLPIDAIQKSDEANRPM
jgi:hypothetical protein